MCMCEAVPPQSLLHVHFSAQCVVESCASHFHHSLQMVTPHQVVTLEGLVYRREGMKHLMHVSCMYCLYSTMRIVQDTIT